MSIKAMTRLPLPSSSCLFTGKSISSTIMIPLLIRLAALLVIIVVLYCPSTISGAAVPTTNSDDDLEKETHRHQTTNYYYTLIGVSGGLQEGFPGYSRLHYNLPTTTAAATTKNSGRKGEQDVEVVKAIFLGRGLVRGYKAFLDLMEPSWREYLEEPAQPYINSNVFATGCYEHANEYWLYLVDSRHAMWILQQEPRFLSLTPDTGTIELDAPQTHDITRNFLKTLLAEQQQQSSSNSNSNKITNVAIPLVTCVYFNPSSHIPSPPIAQQKEEDADGTTITTLVTNYPDSLALWAKVNDTDRTAISTTTKRCASSQQEKSCSPKVWVEANRAEQRYWKGIRTAIRNAEQMRPTLTELAKTYGPPWNCKKKVRFGVDNDLTSTRVNYDLSVQQIESILRQIGYQVNFKTGEVVPLIEQQKEESGTSQSKDEL